MDFVTIALIVLTLLIVVVVAKMFTKHEDEEIHVPGGREMGIYERTYFMFADLGVVINSYVSFVESKVPLTEELLVKAALMIRARHPELRMRVVNITDSRGKKRYCFKPMDETSVDVKTVYSDDWIEAHSDEMAVNFDSENGPLWRLRIVKSNDNTTPNHGIYESIIIATFNHVIIDGTTIMHFIDELLDHLSSAADGRDDLPESLPPHAHIEDALGIGQMSWWMKLIVLFMTAKMRLFPDRNNFLKRFGAEISRNPSVKKATKVYPMEFTEEQTRFIREASRNHGATVNGTLLAAACVAMCQIIQDGKLDKDMKLKISFAANTRRFCKPPLVDNDTFGLFGAAYMPTIKVPAHSNTPDKFWKFASDLTKSTHKSIRDGDGQVFIQFMGFIADLGLSFKDLMKHVFEDKSRANRDGELFLSNLGNLHYLTKEEPRTFELHTKHTGVSTTSFGNVYDNYAATIHGRLTWTVTYATHATTNDQAKEYGDLVAKILEEMCGDNHQ